MDKASDIIILIHYSEIALKKGNRKYFENKLYKNILSALHNIPHDQLKIDYGRFLLFLSSKSSIDETIKRLKKVFGIAHFSVARSGDANIDILKEQIFDEIQKFDFRSFCVRTRRANKHFPLTSPEINRIVGEKIHLGLKKPVSLANPDLTCHIEIYNQQVFYYFERVKGLRGLPVGSSGRVVSLLSSGIDSPVASYLMMKRGCRVTFVHFHSFPLTSKASYHNAIKLAKKLTDYQYSTKIYLVPLIHVQETIILNAPTKLRLILYRRMMLRIAERVAKRERAKALVTGESLGQVASQTLENITAISEVVNLPIFRPLIGMDKEEIIDLAKKIDTFQISTEPYDDCCSYMVPENPETRAKRADVQAAEAQLEKWEELLNQSVYDAEIIKMKFS